MGEIWLDGGKLGTMKYGGERKSGRNRRGGGLCSLYVLNEGGRGGILKVGKGAVSQGQN